MAKSPVLAVGIPWFKREDYPRILEIMTDAHGLHETYDGWREAAEALERRMSSEGHIAVRAEINPDEFLGWCRANGLKADSKARARFASWVASRRVKEDR